MTTLSLYDRHEEETMTSGSLFDRKEKETLTSKSLSNMREEETMTSISLATDHGEVTLRFEVLLQVIQCIVRSSLNNDDLILLDGLELTGSIMRGNPLLLCNSSVYIKCN